MSEYMEGCDNLCGMVSFDDVPMLNTHNFQICHCSIHVSLLSLGFLCISILLEIL